jgi:hypothetical protein
MQNLYDAVAEYFNKGSHIAHDFKHVTRTASIAHYIAEKEGYDSKEAEVAAILHDMGRTVQKEEKGHGPAGVPVAKQLLDDYTDYDEETKRRILRAVADHSEAKTEGLLTHIVQDADMIDGLGAIGIMRACTSKAGLTDYDLANFIPAIGERRGTTICGQIAFQMEWVDFDGGFLHTKTGKVLGKERYDFMKLFLNTLHVEVSGGDLR